MACENEIFAVQVAEVHLADAMTALASTVLTRSAKEAALMQAQTELMEAEDAVSAAEDLVYTRQTDLANAEAALAACQGGGGEEAQEGGPYPDAKEM